VRLDVGYALYAAQKGETDPTAKPLKSFGGHAVMEIVTSFDGNTWRTVYTVRLRDYVYVLHAFQKKSKSGIATPKAKIDLIHQRLAAAAPLQGKAELTMPTTRKTIKVDEVLEGSGNVFADLGLQNADQELTKARLTLQIARIIKDRGLTQVEAAKILGIQQPHVSALTRNRAGSFSVGRLIDFLTALGQDVEITVTPTRKEHGAMSIIFA
jgi:phage-related protein/predicted XRE-type DNA-binding protein